MKAAVQIAIQASIATFLLLFMIGKVSADGLCNLPGKNYSGKSDIILDKSTGIVEQYYIHLELSSNKKVLGHFQRHEIVIDDKNRKNNVIRERYYFHLDKCRENNYRIQSQDLDGYLQFANVNPHLNEMTLTGSIYTYSDSLLGTAEWLYEGLKERFNYQVIPDYDLTKIPIKLKQRFD